ncbi:MAG TPA: 23S rRNA (guanosine(2251)-2'-O)-methyltransferase RlmB, partial [Alphaproteobacteria bacterium]|nr:23S rRNA (guanosine(2251)-2'-O)-methyltransferase RlmB [Alphaproteobacteria bacterium]
HAVREAWLNPERRVHRLIATRAGLEALADALAEAGARDLRRPAPETVEREALDAMLPGGTVHQGAVLVAEPLEAPDLDDILRRADDRDDALVMVLDQVTDPQNVGAILRSSAAFGALAVLVTERHAPELTGTLAKIASGAAEHVPLVRVTNLARGLRDMKEHGFWCVGLAEEGPTDLAGVATAGKIALVLGAEGPGLRRLTRETCDALARLPTRGPIGSLNVSNAAAVALYEAARCRDVRG